VISGGEPTLQLDAALCRALIGAGYSLHLETNGSRALGALAECFEHITMSPKQPRVETMLEFCDDLKVLYPFPGGRLSFEEFNDFPCQTKLLQAVWDKDYDANLKATLCRLYGNPTWRLSVQMHKILGVQ
jgi:organic radical activating enzyme